MKEMRMKLLAEFTKTTLIGSVLVILPIYLAVLLLAKAVRGLLALLTPVTAQLPAGVQYRQAAAMVLLVAVCFVVGLVLRTGPGLRAKNAFEQAVLDRLPGYTFLRGLAKRLTGHDEEQTLQPALVEIEEALVPALIVEELEDGLSPSWSRRPRRRWRAVSISCLLTASIQSTFRSPRRSPYSQSGAWARASTCAR